MEKQNPTKRNKLERLLGDVYASGDAEISASEADGVMRRCADLLLSETEARSRFPQLFHYFDLVPSARAEFELLMGLAQAAAAGQIPAVDAVPPRPDKLRPGFSHLKAVISAAFGGFGSPVLGGAVRGAGSRYDVVEVELEHGALRVEFDLASSTRAPGNWDLAVTVSLEREAQALSLEFAPARMLPADGKPGHEEALDEFGGCVFAGLEAGSYRVELSLGGKTYQVVGVDLPAAPR